MSYFITIFCVCLTAVSLPLGAETIIEVDAGKIIGQAAPMIFGHNIEAADERGIFQQSDLPKPSPDSVNTGKGHWDPIHRQPDATALHVLKEGRTAMLRYPGGCLAHNFDWRMAVGPIESRPDWQFGLDEFLILCKAVGAEPLITLSDYVLPAGQLPQLAADLVEYLNAPAIPRYPQAMKRATNGRVEPYHVKYFEIGNESYHSNHNLKPPRSFTPEAYVDFARKMMTATKAVDPSIQLGIVGHAMNLAEEPDYWDAAVYRDLVPHADFVVHHYYSPGLFGASAESARCQSSATGELLKWKLANTRRQMQKLGGKILPIQITEYNIGGAQNKPPRWQDSYLAGLNVAEFLLEFRKPDSGVTMAAYWQLIGGFFGVIQRNGKDGHNEKAPWQFIKLLTGKSGNELLEVKMKNYPLLEFSSRQLGQVAAYGDRFIPAKEVGTLSSFDLFFNGLNNVKAHGSGDGKLMKFRFDGESATAYPNIITIHRPREVAENNSFSLKARFEARFIPDDDNTGHVALGFGLMDGRGYEATRRAVAVDGLDQHSDWTQYQTDIDLDADCRKITGLIRYEKPRGHLKGTLEIRNLEFSVTNSPVIPAIPAIAVEASRRKDGTLVLTLINRTSTPQAISATITGESIDTGSVSELYQEDVNSAKPFEPKVEELKLHSNSFRRELPPYSLTVFEWNKR